MSGPGAPAVGFIFLLGPGYEWTHRIVDGHLQPPVLKGDLHAFSSSHADPWEMQEGYRMPVPGSHRRSAARAEPLWLALIHEADEGCKELRICIHVLRLGEYDEVSLRNVHAPPQMIV